MEIWVDSADPEQITPLIALGIITGVTTNPKILTQQRCPAEQQIAQLLTMQTGLVAVQVTETEEKAMLEQAQKLHALSERIIVKIPMTEEGIKVLPQLRNRNIMMLATAVFKAEQFLLAAKLGAHYVAPYLHQMQQSGIDIYQELMLMQEMIHQYHFKTKIMAAGIRDISEIKYFAKLGISAMTLTPECFSIWLQSHPLTLQSTKTLNAAWLAFAQNTAGAL